MPADRLLVFAKLPEPGAVKTRLTPPLTPAEAAEVCEASLRDVVARGARERGRVEVWYAGQPSDAAWFARELAGVIIVRQREGDLGERLADAFERSFAAGAARVVIVGADVPTLPDTTLTGAFSDLEDASGVVGPSSDGGYVLIGLRSSAWPRARALFEDVPWSTDAVLGVTLQRAARESIDLRVLPGWYDIDRPEDLARAARDCHPDSHLGRWLRSDAGRAILGT